MAAKTRIVALIPLRGGSKSIPLKNMKPIGGHPLCYWAISAAIKCPEIDEVWVSTDHPQIKEYCSGLGAKVLDRPAEFSTDIASTESVMLHFMGQIQFDILVTLQATSPLTTSQHLSEAIRLLKNNNFDSLLPCVENKRFFWSAKGEPINYDPQKRPRRQDFPGYLMENGAFYLTKKKILEKYGNRLGGKIALYQMPLEAGVELDEPLDWELLENYLAQQRHDGWEEKLTPIKCILSDFDGVFTDNLVWTKTDGHESVACSKADSLALSLYLPRLKLPMTVISAEKNLVVEKRCQKLGLPVITGIANKKNFLDTWLFNNQVHWSEVCYLGNDINDLECLGAAGFAAVPADADPAVKRMVDFVGEKSGGRGFIREVLSLIIDRNKAD